MTAGGREFQVAGAVQLKDRLPISLRLIAHGTPGHGQEFVLGAFCIFDELTAQKTRLVASKCRLVPASRFNLGHP